MLTSLACGDPRCDRFTLCLGEYEERCPEWQPYHVTQGFERDESVVTLVGIMSGPHLVRRGTCRLGVRTPLILPMFAAPLFGFAFYLCCRLV